MFKRSVIGMAVALLAFAASCSSDSESSSTTVSTEPAESSTHSPTDSSTDSSDPSSTGEFSIEALLGQIPTEARGGPEEDVMLAASDLDLATEAADLERPSVEITTDTDFNEVLPWIGPLTGLALEGGTSPVYAQVPEVSSPQYVAEIGAIDDELGWSIVDVSSFIELQSPPRFFTVMNGDFTEADITEAQGDATDGIWKLGGDDDQVNLDGSTAARPLGESMRTALHDGQLAVSRVTPPIEEWLSLPDDDVATLADDEQLSAVAASLDDAGVYSALLFERDFTAPVPPLVSAPLPDSPGFGRFTALGVGQALEGDTRLAVLSYYFADSEAAAAAIDPLTALLEDGSSFVSRRPWSSAFTIRDIAAGENVLTVTLELEEFLPGSVWNLVYAQDNLVTSG